MRSMERLVRAITLVGQIGFSLVTPPLVLIYLAHLAQTRLGWGTWVMVTAIVVGLMTGASSVWRMVRQLAREQTRDEPPRGRSFNDHI